jgi:hypothetical protein
MLEPQLLEPALPSASASQPRSSTSTPIRLLDTQARGHIGHRLLHQGAGGELTEDPIWRWSSTPDRYLDSALRLALASSPDVRLVDTAAAPAIAVTLLAWQLESAGSTQLVGAVELSVTAADRTVRAQMIRRSEPVSAELPGNLAAAAGRLMQSLASESLAQAIQTASSKKQPPYLFHQLFDCDDRDNIPRLSAKLCDGRCELFRVDLD